MRSSHVRQAGKPLETDIKGPHQWTLQLVAWNGTRKLGRLWLTSRPTMVMHLSGWLHWRMLRMVKGLYSVSVRQRARQEGGGIREGISITKAW